VGAYTFQFATCVYCRPRLLQFSQYSLGILIQSRNKFLTKKFFYQCVCKGVYKPSLKDLNTTPLGEPMATARSWTTHELIQKCLICIHRKLYSLMKLTKTTIISAVMIILITHVFLKGCCI